jgi:hypothetical protein
MAVLRHETVWESGSISPCVLNLGTRQRRLVTSIPRQLFSRTEPPIRVGCNVGTSEPVRTRGTENRLLFGIKQWHRDHPSRSLVTTLTELFKFFNLRNLPISIIPHESHNLVLSESHPGRHGYKCCCDFCEVSAELEQSAKHRVGYITQYSRGRWNASHEISRLTPELNPSAQRCLTRFFTGILLIEMCISLIYA